MAKVPLLTPQPEIGPGFKSGGFVLDHLIKSMQVHCRLVEHEGGRLALTLQEQDKDGTWKTIGLMPEQTEDLRRQLNRAHRERAR